VDTLEGLREEEPDEPEGLAVLIERSAELKRDLVDFACSPRLKRSLAAAMRREPRPGVSVIGDRLFELAWGGRR